MPFFNTKDVGPVVLEIPPADDGPYHRQHHDVWQAALEDVGPAGVDKGKGGKYLILPPGTRTRCRMATLHCRQGPISYALLRSVRAAMRPTSRRPSPMPNVIRASPALQGGETAINNRWTCGTVKPLTFFLTAAADGPRKNGPEYTGSYDDATLANCALHNHPCPDIACFPQSRFQSATACR